jgi:3-methyladenine DNA glycosylase AlkD
MATLIDDPKQVTREQIDRQVADVDFWMLSYSYCSNLLPKVPFIPALAEEWMNSVDHLKRRCGFALLYQIARDNKKLPYTYFIPFIGRIEKELQGEENFVKDAMNAALFAIGKRSEELNTLALEAAKRIGKVTVDYGDNSCQALDVVAHLTSDRKRKNYNE